MNRYVLYHAVGIAALLCVSFFFSCTETTLFSLSDYQVKKLQRRRDRRGALVARLLSNPRRLLISILIGNMFVNIFASVLGDSLTRRVIPGAEGTLVAIILMTFAVLIMGEITPKTIAIQWNERLAPLVAPLINAIGVALFPVRRVVRAVSDAVISAFTGPVVPAEPAITEEEIKTAIRLGSREGVVDPEERQMIQGVFNFADRRVAALMRPRPEVLAFEAGMPIDRIERTIRERQYSRIPVYEGSFDNVIGILHVKDLMRGAPAEGGLRALLKPAYFVPESMKASSLLREFRRRRMHIAVVADEYGSVSGIVTLDDLLEEVVGEVRDKGAGTPLFRQVDLHTFRVSARMGLDAFNELFGTQLADPRNATIGGCLVRLLGRIPEVGRQIRHGGLLFTVAAATGSRVDELVVSREARR
ncbi:MAG: hemolysin family protein [bacterium]|nr:hemolysin family protein [bacterium]